MIIMRDLSEKRENIQAAVAALGRHRMLSDGEGITTLVCFQGCPLRCKFCINPFAMSSENEKAVWVTPQKLYEKVKIDELYFLATGGGVTFGGGEPLLHPEFIREFRNLCGPAWHLCVETSLAVPWEHIEMVADAVDVFYFDCKDTDPDVYQNYTGKENALAIENIRRLSQRVSPEKIVVRIPLIPGFNTEAHRQKSVELFKKLGLSNFDLFTYIIPSET